MKDWSKTSSIFLTCFIILILASCANIGTLSGGPIDEKAPGIDSLKPPSPANKTTQFNKTKIKITFDEWVKLNNTSQNIVISPEITPTPKYKLVGKALEIDLTGCTLDANTTYNINYGNAIQDITEGNTSKNLEYIFSTGDIIDSLTVAGSINDFQTNEPINENVLLALYKDNGELKYTTKANSNGKFKINNINDLDYTAVAFIDKNGNNKLDSTEDRSFENSISGLDTTKSSFDIFPKYTNTVMSYKTNGDYYIYELENEVRFNEVKYNSEDIYIENYIISTSEKLKFTDQVLNIISNPTDIDHINASKLIKIGNTKIEEDRKSPYEISDSIVYLYFNQKIINIDTSKIEFKNDSTNIEITDLNYSSNYIQFNISNEPSVNVYIQDSAINGNIGFVKSTEFKIRTSSQNENGGLEITLENKEENNIYYLVSSITNQIYKPDSNKDVLLFNDLPAGSYKLKIIEDTNRNNAWDTGNILRNIQPEKITYSKEFNVKKAWTSKETY